MRDKKEGNIFWSFSALICTLGLGVQCRDGSPSQLPYRDRAMLSHENPRVTCLVCTQ